jgi:hypothetical protein
MNLHKLVSFFKNVIWSSTAKQRFAK